MNWTHGGDVAGFELEYGRMPLDFSASVSPWGMPEGARQAAARAIDHAAAYPDPLCRKLRQALSDHLGVPASYILCGNGASDLIYRLCTAMRPKRGLVPVPTFSEYETALTMVGCSTERFRLNGQEDFSFTCEILSHITPDVDAVFLCNPNNPTGKTVPQTLLRQILGRCRETGALLVLDECFAELLDAPENHTLLPELPGGGLLILRAFTKLYGMAGLRLGYCLASDDTLLQKMALSGPPWPVSSTAQAAGIAALEDGDYRRSLRGLLHTQRLVLAQGLSALGLRVISGEANFLLFYSRDTELGAKLRQKGVLLRDCRDFPGLGPGWYRTAVRTQQENQALLAAIREVGP